MHWRPQLSGLLGWFAEVRVPPYMSFLNKKGDQSSLRSNHFSARSFFAKIEIKLSGICWQKISGNGFTFARKLRKSLSQKVT